MSTPAAPGAPTPSARHGPAVLRYPSGTTLPFFALILTVTLTSSFVGDWLYLSLRQRGDPLVPPPQWLWGPPVAVLAGALVLTMGAPRWLEYRHHWVPVPPDLAGAALARYDAVAAEAGLRKTPILMWNAASKGRSAVAYGSPRAYRVAITPALVGAARRDPTIFDLVLVHELAHVRHHDVTLAYYAVCVWYALLPALAAPLAWRAVDHDLSLVPEYLLRVTALTVLVYMVRAALLRVREHYADVRAGSAPASADALIGALQGSHSPGRRVIRPLSVHPSAAARVRVVGDPGRLARLSAAELFAVSVTATWSLPLLEDVLANGDPTAVLRAAQVSRWVVFGVVGAYTGTVLARWAGAGGGRSGTVAGAGGLVAGLSVGSVFSLANPGFLINAGADIAGAAVTAVVCGAYLLWAAELAQIAIPAGDGPGRRRLGTTVCVVLTAAVFALVADASLAISELVRLGATSFLGTYLIDAITTRPAAVVLAVVVIAAGIVAVGVRTRQARPYGVLALDAGLGVMVSLVIAGVHLRAHHNAAFDADRYYAVAVWMVAAAGAIAAAAHAMERGTGRLLSAFAGAAVTVVVAAAGFALVEDIAFGSTLGISDVAQLIRDAGSLAVLLVPVAGSLAWLTLGPHGVQPHSPRVVRTVIGTGLVATVSAVAIGMLPGVVTKPSPAPDLPRTELAGYLANQVLIALQERNTAVSDLAKIPQSSPDAGALIRMAVLPQYDNALQIVGNAHLTSPQAVRVRSALRTCLRAERAQAAALADAVEGRQPWSAYHAAAVAADNARDAWAKAYDEAIRTLQK